MATALDLLEGDTDLLGELASLFVEEYPELHGLLSAAVTEGNLETAGKLAHRLKGSLGTLSALPAMEAAFALEKAGKAEDESEVAIRWDEFTECPYEDLRNPGRVHVDAYGHVHLCQGLSMGNMWETPLSALVRSYDPDSHPICGPQLRGGPALLAKEHNVEHDDEYVDACHLCYLLRLALMDRFPQFLAPGHAIRPAAAHIIQC